MSALRRAAIVTVVVAALAALASAESACSGLCKPTSKTAGLAILSGWCERYTQCDPKRGTTDSCISTRMSVAQVPDETGCGASCSDDESGCRRSSCDQARIDACKKDSLAMKCEDQVKNQLVVFPPGCDSCFQ
ncbi:MAG: hypothetical protein JNL38_09175 [Myxococcales bacterium]|nr:hypothetical protein [Myxococcales bacterium]